MRARAFVFCRTSGAHGLGHVGGAFQLPNGMFRCFGTENHTGGGFVPAAQKGFWCEDHDEQGMFNTFRRSRKIENIVCPPYNLYKVIEKDNPDYNKAIQTLQWCSQQDYMIVSPAIVKARTCEDDVCDTLSAYGLNMPWTVTNPAPNGWFLALWEHLTLYKLLYQRQNNLP
jgi:hypothetical protein